MRRTLIPFAAVALAACQPVFELSDTMACPHDVIDLDGGLTYMLVQDPSGSGVFDFDPDRPLEAKVKGSYDLESGEFSWTRTFDAGYRLVDETVRGTGTAYTDGDVDLAYTRTIKAPGLDEVRQVREVRLGCKVEKDLSNKSGVPVVAERGTYDADGYSYTLERETGGILITAEGQLRRDFTREESEAWRLDDLQYEHTITDDGKGKVIRSFDQLDPVAHTYGTERTTFEGDHVFDYEVESFSVSESWSYRYDVKGTGDGEVVFTPRSGRAYTCDVIWDKGDCAVACDGQAEEDCE